MKTTATGGFRLESHRGSDGALLWKVNSDYIVAPGANWTPSWGPTLVPNDAKVIMPAAGGTLLSRSDPQQRARQSHPHRLLRHQQVQAESRRIQRRTVYINTPVTSDGAGNIYFGYIGTTRLPARLPQRHSQRAGPDLQHGGRHLRLGGEPERR